MNCIGFVALLCVLLLSVATHAQQDFMIGPSGSAVGHNPYPGYTLITIDDLQSSAFASSYNAVGLPVATPFGNLATDFCPFLQIAGNNFAAVGSPLQINPTILAPFTTGQSMATHTSDYQQGTPMWLGTVNAQNLDNNTYVGPFSSSFSSQFYAISAGNLENLDLSCNPSHAAIAIYRKARFFIAPYGADYPNAPSNVPGATLATLADVRTENFASPYNLNGIETIGAYSVPHVCCAVRVAEGYLTTAGSSSLAPYSESSQNIECPANSLSNNVRLGTANDGSFPLQYFGTLNYSILQSFTAPTSPPNVCDSSQTNVWSIYKASALPSPTPAPTSGGNCYDMEVQVSYYLPDGTICLAVVYHTYMQLGYTYSNMVMSGLNECGGSIGAVSAFNVEIAPYSSTHLIGRTTGATSCNCQAGGVNLYGFIPLNESGHSEMTTICQLPIQEFYFCNVLMFIRKGPVQCP